MKAYIVEKARLEQNIRILLDRAGDAAVYGVIKGNGYGLGLIPMAELLRVQGVRRFAVTEVSEVRALRQAGFQREEILMLRETRLAEELRELMELGAVITVGSTETAEAVEALDGDSTACHIKIDTGMGRYGFLPGDLEAIEDVCRLPCLEVTGIYTHFYSAFDNEQATRAQFSAFLGVIEGLRGRGIDPGLRHCCNSSAFLKYPDMHLDGVRLGSAILGRLSFAGCPELQPVGWCEAQIEVIRQIPKGHSVGYGAGFTAKRDTTIAVCNVGYFHGFGPASRTDLCRFRDCLVDALSAAKTFLTHRGLTVSLHGREAPVLGHVGMVQTVFDVTDIPCQVGDPVRFDIKPLNRKDMDVVFR